MVPIDLTLPGEAREDLARLVRSCGCRLYAAVEGPEGALVLSGAADSLGRLRSLLVPLRALRFVRERLEEALAGHAAPAGLPRLEADLYRRSEVVDERPAAPGTTLLVSREFTFDAAHNLPRYNGKCERLHGHTFRVKVTVKAPLDNWSGMAFDFGDIKTAVNQRVVDILDHSYVNEIVPNPSAECIAIWAWEQLADLPLHEIKVWETPSCCVTYHGPPTAADAG
jgi:6-pyruvoyltetrahydropterin/6-carboxytetrahydropterin synthase